MKFSILIPTINNVDYLKLLVKSIRESTNVEYEFLIFANQADEETKDYIRSEQFEYSEYSPHNLGVSRPCNSLFKRSTGDIIIYTGDDYVFTPGWDQAILDKVNKDIFYQYMTFCCFEPQWDNPCMNAPIDYGRNARLFEHDRFLKTWKDNRKILQDVHSPWGPPIVSRELWQAIGGFSEDFPIFASDSDFVAKIYYLAMSRQMPYEFRGLSDVGVYHFQSVGNNKLPNLAQHQMNGKAHFVQKWGIDPPAFYRDVLKAGQIL